MSTEGSTEREKKSTPKEAKKEVRNHRENLTNSNSPDKRNTKNRFGWVKRLMQGQNRQPSMASANYAYNGRRRSNSMPLSGQELPNVRIVEFSDRRKSSFSNSNYSGSETRSESSSHPDRRNSLISDQTDNISTTPLKSIVSLPSTKAPSILSDEITNDDSHSYVALTAETSIAPSVLTSGNNYLLYPASLSSNQNNPQDRDSTRERDSESIVTLASSSRRTRRRSIDTNCSTAGIPPASIMERLSVNPTATTSSGVSVHDDE